MKSTTILQPNFEAKITQYSVTTDHDFLATFLPNMILVVYMDLDFGVQPRCTVGVNSHYHEAAQQNLAGSGTSELAYTPIVHLADNRA